MAHDGKPNPLHHVQDIHPKEGESWMLFESFLGGYGFDLPTLTVAGYTFQITKFMVLEVVAALLILLIYVPIARRARDGRLPKGGWWNAFEAMLTFVRDNIVKPTFPEGMGDRYVPFFWTLFLFILFNNLLGMVPFLGSPTSSIWVTGGLAVCAFVVMHAVSIARVGVIAYLKSMWIPVDAPYIGPAISLLIFVIELLGTVIKSFVLAVRLFANMFAGHMVLAYILAFIWAENWWWGWPAVTFTSVLGVTALSLLELFVAFLQAYVFVFLTSLFTGMALEHAQHAAHAVPGHGPEAEHTHATGPGHAEPAHH